MCVIFYIYKQVKLVAMTSLNLDWVLSNDHLLLLIEFYYEYYRWKDMHMLVGYSVAVIKKKMSNSLAQLSVKLAQIILPMIIVLGVVGNSLNTVKPLYSGHPSDFSKVSTIWRCPLWRGYAFSKSQIFSKNIYFLDT